MPLNLVKPFPKPYHEIECVEWNPPLSDRERADFRQAIELRRLDLNGRFLRLRPLVGETDKPELL